MEAAQSVTAAKPLNMNFLDAEKDKPRGQPRVRMRVVNRNTRALPVLENVIGPGEQEITVYLEDVPRVMAMIEPEPGKLAIAIETFEKEIAEQVIKRLDRFEGTVDDIIPALRAKDPRYTEIHQRVLDTTGTSVESVFQRLTKRSPKPLVSAEVVPDSEHAEPQRKHLERETERLAQAIGKALGTKPAASDADIQAMIDARVNALVDAKVKELLGESKGGARR